MFLKNFGIANAALLGLLKALAGVFDIGEGALLLRILQPEDPQFMVFQFVAVLTLSFPD